MKKFTWSVYGLVIIFLFACTLPTGGTPPGDGGPSIPLPSPSATKPAPPASDTPTSVPAASDTPTSIPPASDTSTPATPESGALQGGNVPTGFDIPSQNDPAPAGILEQLSWADVGGGAGEPPQVCGNCDVVMGVDRISVSNFQPSQELKVVIYRSECKYQTAKYVTTLSIQADKTGNFSAGLGGPTQDLIVVSVLDGKTGQRIWKRPFEDYLKLYCPDCPGAPPQRLKVNQMAYVCTSKDSVKLREGPGKNFSTIKMLVPGADATIIGGPTCADNWSWWKVKTESGYIGWMSEGGDETDPYFICPKP